MKIITHCHDHDWLDCRQSRRDIENEECRSRRLLDSEELRSPTVIRLLINHSRSN